MCTVDNEFRIKSIRNLIANAFKDDFLIVFKTSNIPSPHLNIHLKLILTNYSLYLQPISIYSTDRLIEEIALHKDLLLEDLEIFLNTTNPEHNDKYNQFLRNQISNRFDFEKTTEEYCNMQAVDYFSYYFLNQYDNPSNLLLGFSNFNSFLTEYYKYLD